MICFICILLILFFLMFIVFWFEISSEIKSIKKEDHEIWDRVCHIWNNLPYYSWYGDVGNQINELKNNLTTEIACLITKNNDDIKRVKKGFQKWDIFEYDGVRFFIYDIENWEINNGNSDRIYYTIRDCFGCAY